MPYDFSKTTNLAKNVSKKSKERSNIPPMRMLPIESLKENPLNEQIFGYNEQDKIKNSISEIGLKGAIIVWDLGDGTYEIASGHQRKRSAEQSGIKEIPCIIYQEPDDETKAKTLLGLNQQRSETPEIMMNSILYYKREICDKSPKCNYLEKTAAFFQISKATVTRYIAISNLVPPLKKLISDQNISYSGLADARGIEPEKQEQLADMICKYRTEHEQEQVGRAVIDQMIKKLTADESSAKKIKNENHLTSRQLQKLPYNKELEYRREEFKGILVSDKILDKKNDPKAALLELQELKNIILEAEEKLQNMIK